MAWIKTKSDAQIVLGLLRVAPLASWPRILGYFFARALRRTLGVKLFTSTVIRLKELSFVADTAGMSGLVFLDQILVQGIYDFPQEQTDREAQVLFDVGANCGFYALTRCRRVETLRAFCFEPHPVTFAKLTQNVAANHLSARIAPVQAAVGSRPGECTLQISVESSMGVVVGAAQRLADAKGRPLPATEVKVLLLTLDEFAARERVWPDVLKVDVEGFEVEVLKGADACLRHAGYAIVEFDTDENRRQCEALLRAHQFEIEVRDPLLFAHKP